MRILAIRGQNLASLERTFEIDLASEPLGSAGLFAITGNTGAGKSTLLDAMCAALFDRTPRLEGRSPFKVGRGEDDQRVGAFDVRALLRRGAGEGWAEVDFEGKDRRRYRARWEVHRARRKADGKLQDQQMVLRRLDDGVGRPLGGTRGETLRAIEQALGLSFEQFKRSALLAQGEFAAFLRAESSQRASLLERVTGTALYGALSMAAHRRAVELAGERRGRRGELDAAAVLDDERRAALEAELAGAAAGTAAARARASALARASRWREQLDELTRGEADARARAEQAERAVAAAAAEARELAAAQAAEPARGAWLARARAVAALDQARRLVGDAEAGAADAGAEAERTAAAALAAREARRTHEAEVERVQPALTRAAAVDAELAAAVAEEVTARRVAVEAEAAARAAADDVGRRAAAVARLAARAAETEAWLAGAARLAPLAADGARWAAAVRRAIEARRAWTRARAELDELVPARHDADAALAGARRAVDEAGERHRQALLQAAAAEQAAEQRPLAPAEEAWLATEERARRVEALVTLAGEAAARAAARERLGAEAVVADEEAAAAAGEVEVATRAGEQAAVRLGEARAALERLQLAASLEHARAALRDGEPCALCGATDHPWAGRGALDAVVVEQAARVDALAAEVDGAGTRAAAAAARLAVARSRAADRRAEAARVDEALEELDGSWRRAVAVLGELPLVPSARTAEARGWAGELAAQVQASSARAAAVRRDAQAAAQAAAQAQARALATAHDLEQVERARDEAAAAVAATEARQLVLGRDLDELTRERARLADELAPAVAAVPALASWLDGVAAGDGRRGGADDAARAAARAAARDGRRGGADDAARAAAALDEALARYRQQAAAAGELRDALAAERAARAAAEAALAQLRPAALRAAAAAAERLERVRGLREVRGGLLGGRRADEVAAALRRAGEEARRAEQVAVERATSAVAHHAAESSRLHAAREQVKLAGAALEVAERELADAAVAAGSTVAELGRQLARDPAWLTATRARHEQREAAVASARAVLGERQRQRQAAQARRGELAAALAEAGVDGAALDEPVAAWTARLAAAQAADEAAATAAGVLAEQLRADDAARTRRAQVAAALAAFDEAALPYQQLDELIGSADGKKLRDFAQSLTLDRLLAAANRHLDDLAPRYQLERVGGLDLELQVVDRELGDDVRAIASLSGGESFLVSLALALGLSSLSSSGVEVRTLLIDEGFGSLDLATLDTALAVLDALRATGRQVGIVSHVPGLDERVPARVVVRSLGGGRSAVEVRA